MTKVKSNNKLKDFINNFKNINIKDKKIILLTIASILVLVVLISTSYAMFFARGESEEKKVYTAGDLTVNFDDSTSNAININPAQPVSDEYGSSLEPYTFTITNNGTLSATYKIMLTDETIINPNGLTNTEVKTNIKYQINDNSPALLSSALSNVLLTGEIPAGKSLTFNLRLWITEEATSSMENTTYSAKVAVSGKAIKDGDRLLTEALLGTYLGVGYENVTYASPTFSESSTDRGLFVQQGDPEKSIDGKPTYYFRGSSTNDTINPEYKMNNYVKFGTYTSSGSYIYYDENFEETTFTYTEGDPILWRVVRINEDGSIRLISENVVSNPVAFNSTWYYSKYINDDGTNSEVKTTVETWYNANIGSNSTLDSKVVQSSFCNDISGIDFENYFSGNAYARLSSTTPSPIFTCPEGAITADEKVGMITADEMFYGGALSGQSVTNNTTYLNNNSFYWTLTPKNSDNVFFWYHSNKYLGNDCADYSDPSPRAVINLLPSVTVTGGDGLSAETAYVIE